MRPREPGPGHRRRARRGADDHNIVTLIINGSIHDTLLTRDKQLQLVLASDAYAQVALAPPAPALGPSGGGLPLPPGISLATGWSVEPSLHAIERRLHLENRVDVLARREP